MTPDDARAWGRVARDIVIVALGAFILLHEELSSRAPNPLLIAAGLVALGLPPALRADEWLGGRNKDTDKK